MSRLNPLSRLAGNRARTELDRNQFLGLDPDRGSSFRDDEAKVDRCVRELLALLADDQETGFDLTEKGQAYLDENRPLTRLQEAYVVDGQPFECLADAERYALDLARVLGSRVEILFGLVSENRLRLAEVVRPGNDARFGDESSHRERRMAFAFQDF